MNTARKTPREPQPQTKPQSADAGPVPQEQGSEAIAPQDMRPPSKDSRQKENDLYAKARRSGIGLSAELEPQGIMPGEAEVAPATAGAGSQVAGNNVTNGDLEVRPQSYLIGHSRELLPAGLEPVNLQKFAEELNSMQGVKIKNVLHRPPGTDTLGLLANVPAQSEDLIVAEMTDEKADFLRNQPQVVIEENLPLTLPDVSVPLPTPSRHPSVLWPESAGFDLQVRVCADAGEPLSGAEVYFFGRGQTRAVTDSNGEARVSLIGETPGSVSGIYVKPKADYWERWIHNPLLVPNDVFNLPMKPLSEWYPGFPAQELDGWGLAAMNLSQLAAGRYNGAGIKVAIVDSGAAVTHVQLQGQVQKGVDLVGGSPESWDQDTIMHGTHCAGVIAARDVGQGIRGIAPEAQLFIYKIFPGGEFDTLIRALEECIREQVDLVNLSLGAGSSSVFVNEWLQEAKNQGIACIVAAGNTSGPVQFPASSGSVLAVSAIGKVGQFPADTFHSEQVSGAPDSSGYFSAKFTCFGPQVGVCAPGVGILSTVPPNDYAAWDGTSMAAPHVTGLAALILAHHPDFQSAPYNQRSAQRVDRLFRILRETSQPLNLGQLRTGAGLPDAQSAISAVLGADHAGGSETNSGSPGESALDRLFEKARASGISSTNGGQ